MNFITQCFRRIQRQWLIHVFLVLQVGLFFNGLLLTFAAVQEYTDSIMLFQRIKGLNHAVYWTIDDSFYNSSNSTMGFSAYAAEIVDAAMDTGVVKSIGNINTTFFPIDSETCDLQIYNDALARNIQLPLSSGNWFVDGNMGHPEILVDEYMGRKYPVGSFVDVNLYDVYDNRYETKQFEVIGVLDMKGYVFDFYSGGDGLTAGDFFQPLMGYAIIKESFAQIKVDNHMNTRMVFYNEDAGGSERERIDAFLKASGFIISAKSAMDNSIISLTYRVGYELPYNMTFVVLGLLGLAASMYASTIMNRRENAIYYICGARYGWVTGLEWIRYLMIVLISGLVTFLLSHNEFVRVFIGNSTYLFTFGTGCGLIFFVLLLTTIQNKSVKPMEELRR